MIKINIDLYQESLLLKLFIYIKYYIFIFNKIYNILNFILNIKYNHYIKTPKYLSMRTRNAMIYKVGSLYGTGNYLQFSRLNRIYAVHPNHLNEIILPINFQVNGDQSETHELIEIFKENILKQQKLLIDFFTLSHMLYLIVVSDNPEQQHKFEQDFFGYILEDLSYRQSLPMLIDEIDLNFSKHKFGYCYQLLKWLCNIFKSEFTGTSIEDNGHKRFMVKPFPIIEEVLKFHQNTKKINQLNLSRTLNFYTNIETAIEVFIRKRHEFFDLPDIANFKIASKINKTWHLKVRSRNDSDYGHQGFQIQHLKLWAYSAQDLSNNEIKIILHNFNNHIKALLPGIKYVKKVAYDKLTGLQVDFVIWIDELNNGKIETAWKRATQPIFPQILCMVYKRKLSNIEQLEMVKNFVHFALRIPCLLETELMLKVPTVRNFTTSRK